MTRDDFVKIQKGEGVSEETAIEKANLRVMQLLSGEIQLPPDLAERNRKVTLKYLEVLGLDTTQCVPKRD